MIILDYILCFLIGLILMKLYKDPEISEYKNKINLLEKEKEQITKEKETIQKIFHSITDEDVELLRRKIYTLIILNDKDKMEDL